VIVGFRYWSFVAAALLAAAPASAGVVYDGGAPDQSGQIFAQFPNATAMSFTVGSSNITVTGANWWGGCFPATTCGASLFDMAILSDNSGAPGTTLLLGVSLDGNQTATGNLIGPPGGQWDEYAYSADFGSSITLFANTTYWFGLEELNSEPGGVWGQEQTSSAPAGAALSWYNDGAWGPLPEQLAFQLTDTQKSDVPEPATLALFGAGLAGFAAMRRRKKAK
jgi:hypothetical protein